MVEQALLTAFFVIVGLVLVVVAVGLWAVYDDDRPPGRRR